MQYAALQHALQVGQQRGQVRNGLPQSRLHYRLVERQKQVEAPPPDAL